MATKTNKNPFEKVLTAAVEAAEELGKAAVHLRSTWDHVESAREKGRPATTAISRTIKKGTRSAVRNAKHMLPHKKTHTSRSSRNRK